MHTSTVIWCAGWINEHTVVLLTASPPRTSVGGDYSMRRSWLIVQWFQPGVPRYSVIRRSWLSSLARFHHSYQLKDWLRFRRRWKTFVSDKHVLIPRWMGLLGTGGSVIGTIHAFWCLKIWRCQMVLTATRSAEATVTIPCSVYCASSETVRLMLKDCRRVYSLLPSGGY